MGRSFVRGASPGERANLPRGRRQAGRMAQKEDREMIITINGKRYKWNVRRALGSFSEAVAFILTAVLIWGPVYMILKAI